VTANTACLLHSTIEFALNHPQSRYRGDLI